MNLGYCKLCGKYKELCNSHAIPDSAFKYITRQGNGKAISIKTDTETPVEFTSDSWGVDLLCAACESGLNENFDQYGISVLWRISVSHHANYSRVKLTDDIEEEIRNCLLEKQSLPSAKYVVSVSKMTDSTNTNGLDAEQLRTMQFSPFVRNYLGLRSVCFIFFGFFIQIYVSRISKKHLCNVGILNGTSSIFFAPYVEVLRIPEILQTFVEGLNKQFSGNTRVTL
jgi:hypothetical protein